VTGIDAMTRHANYQVSRSARHKGAVRALFAKKGNCWHPQCHRQVQYARIWPEMQTAAGEHRRELWNGEAFRQDLEPRIVKLLGQLTHPLALALIGGR